MHQGMLLESKGQLNVPQNWIVPQSCLWDALCWNHKNKNNKMGEVISSVGPASASGGEKLLSIHRAET